MTTKQEEAHCISQGVDTLINRLKNEGVASGQKKAEEIIQAAEQKANDLLNKARKEAKKLIESAHAEIQREKRATDEALQLAARNMRLDLRQRLIDRFRTEIARLVHKELKKEEVMREIILTLTAQSVTQLKSLKKGEMEIILPETVLEFEAIRKNPGLLEKDPLKHLVQGAMRDMLAEGITFKINTANKNESGFTVRMVGSDVELDMTEKAITDMLLKHLQPRFRALLEGLMT